MALTDSYVDRTHVADFDEVTNWFALKLVLVYTDRNGVEHRSAPSDAWYQNGVGAGGVPCPRISIQLYEPHQRALAAEGSLDVEVYTTKRSDGATKATTYNTTFSNAEDVVGTYYLTQRTPLQEDSNGYFVPDFMRYEYDGTYVPSYSSGNRVRTARTAIPLFTDGGELEPLRPPASNVVKAVGGYGFLVPSEFPYELWPTKPLERGRAPEWNPNLIVPAPAGAGNIVALGALGDRLYLLCEQGVWELFVGGGGPDATGAGGFGAMRKIHDGDGCLGPQTVVDTPAGVFFVSDSGPKLIASDRVVDVGEPLEALMVPQEVLDVAYHEKEKEIWVVMSDGNHFIFNPPSQVWTDTQLLAKSAAYYDSKLWRLANTGQVHKENDTAVDGASSTPILARVTTGWINLGDPQGFKRFREVSMLLRHLGGTLGTVSIKLAYDYDDTVVDTFTWTAAEFLAFERVGHFVVRPSRQKASAIKITFEEGLVSQGQSNVNDIRWSLVGWEIEVSAKEGLIKLEQGAKK